MSDLFQTMAADAAAAVPTDADAASVRVLATELAEIELRIAKGAQLMKDLAARREIIMRRELVDAMDALRMDNMGLPDYNCDIVTGEYVHASLPNPEGVKDMEEAARRAELRKAGIAWLIENEFDDIIKTTVTIDLPRGRVADAQRIREFVESMPELDPETGMPLDNGPPIGYSASVDETVHWGTLTSFVKEQLKRPEVVLPLEQLGASVGRIAKIVKRKTI